MKRLLYWLLPIGWMGLIFYSSSTPYQEQDIKPMLGSYIDFSFFKPVLNWINFTYNNSTVSIEELGVEGLIEFFIRKGAHFTVFFILLLFFYIAFRKTTQFKMGTVIFFSLFMTIAYAIIDELHQGITPNRTPYIGDIFIDSIGAVFAVLIIIIFHRWRQNTIKSDKFVK
ncbi:VanZ family protein [Oceanobacillus halophilus]|uniref:VanZ family protein n=1 Tax=Oceanobacillus halophilus TaxID=930130 RepID=A0A495A6X8_9BACI|nr:VanZ family protein [Oceanobacillus halophilus]RKQ35587.1 VanZ family protein [Oceanobacillus halophilus]